MAEATNSSPKALVQRANTFNNKAGVKEALRTSSPIGAHGAQLLPFGSQVKPDNLYRAAAKGELDAVAKMLESSWPSVAVLDEALSRACSTGATGQLQVAKLLLLHGAAVEPPAHTQSFAPLYTCCEGGNVLVAREILRRGARVDRASPEGDTALSRAAFNGCVPMVKLLLEHHASLEASNEGGELGDFTPLERAIAGDEPNLHTAKAWNQGDWPACISLLEQAGQTSDAGRRARSLWSRLHEAVRVRPYALHWLAEGESSRRARGLLTEEPAQEEEAPKVSAEELMQQWLPSGAAPGAALAQVDGHALGPAEVYTAAGSTSSEGPKVGAEAERIRGLLADGHLLSADDTELLELMAATEELSLVARAADVQEMGDEDLQGNIDVQELHRKQVDGVELSASELLRLEVHKVQGPEPHVAVVNAEALRLPLASILASDDALLDSNREDDDWEGSSDPGLSLIAEDDEEQLYDADGNILQPALDVEQAATEPEPEIDWDAPASVAPRASNAMPSTFAEMKAAGWRQEKGRPDSWLPPAAAKVAAPAAKAAEPEPDIDWDAPIANTPPSRVSTPPSVPPLVLDEMVAVDFDSVQGSAESALAPRDLTPRSPDSGGSSSGIE